MSAGRLRQARQFILAHPEFSKSQVAAETGISEATVARARRDLIAEGLIAPPPNSRRTPVQPKEPPARRPDAPAPDTSVSQAESDPVAPPAVPPKKSGGSLFDSQALIALAEMIDVLVDSGDDEQVQKRLLKQCLTFAFRPDLHPDTRMSASQMWAKLRDMAKAKDLGPSKPKTFEDGRDRLRDIMIACGPEMTLAAVHEAFTVKEPASGEATNDQAAPSSGTPQAPGAAGHASDPPQAEMLRPIDVEVRRHGDAPQSMGHPDLPGPTPGRESSPGDPRASAHPHGEAPWDQ